MCRARCWTSWPRSSGWRDPSQVKRYTERTKTRFDHQWEIRQVYGLQGVLRRRGGVRRRGWRPARGRRVTARKRSSLDGVAWLRERKVLLPGVSTLARLVAKVRDDTTRRLWGVLEGLLTTGQRYVLDQLLEVPPGSRVSDLERWRKGPAPRGQRPDDHQGAGPGRGDHRRSGWPSSAPRRWCRRGGWASWPGTG